MIRLFKYWAIERGIFTRAAGTLRLNTLRGGCLITLFRIIWLIILILLGIITLLVLLRSAFTLWSQIINLQFRLSPFYHPDGFSCNGRLVMRMAFILFLTLAIFTLTAFPIVFNYSVITIQGCKSAAINFVWQGKYTEALHSTHYFSLTPISGMHLFES